MYSFLTSILQWGAGGFVLGFGIGKLGRLAVISLATPVFVLIGIILRDKQLIKNAFMEPVKAVTTISKKELKCAAIGSVAGATLGASGILASSVNQQFTAYFDSAKAEPETMLDIVGDAANRYARNVLKIGL